MKKFIALSLSTLLLASCGAPKEVKYESFDEVTLAMQNELVKDFKYEKLPEIYQQKGLVALKVDVADATDTKKSISLDANLGFDAKVNSKNQDSDMNFDLNVKANASADVINESGAVTVEKAQDVDASAKFDVLTKDGTLYASLKDVNLEGGIKDLAEMKDIVAQLEEFKKVNLNKYISLTLPKELTEMSSNKLQINEDSIDQIKKIISEDKLFTLVSENKEATSGYYEYKVNLNSESLKKLLASYFELIPALKEAGIEYSDEIINEEKINEAKFDLKVNKTDKSDFIIEYADEEGKFKLESSKTKLLINVDSKEVTFNIDLTKNDGSYKGTVSISDNLDKQKISFEVEAKITNKSTAFKIKLIDYPVEDMKVNNFEFSYNVDVSELKAVNVKVPEEAFSIDSYLQMLPLMIGGGMGNPYGNPYANPYGQPMIDDGSTEVIEGLGN